MSYRGVIRSETCIKNSNNNDRGSGLNCIALFTPAPAVATFHLGNALKLLDRAIEMGIKLPKVWLWAFFPL